MFKLFSIIVIGIFALDLFTNFEEPEKPKPVEIVKTSRTIDLAPEPSYTEKAVPEQVQPETVQPVSQPVQQSQKQYVEPVSAPAPAVQSDAQRVASLGVSLGSPLPVVFASCQASSGVDVTTIRGCYYPGDNKIIITQYATMYDDSYVSCIIRHEMRHAWQYQNGMFDIQNGVIVNRSWLESDATAASGCS